MASKDALADGDFKARVDKIFGSLAFSRASSPPSSLQQTVLWSLTDKDVEKKEWRRDPRSSYERGETPCSSSFDEALKKQKRPRRSRKRFEDGDEVFEDGADGDEEEQRRSGTGDDVDEINIRSSIGLDRTLDDEEEEDEYDKVALGKGNGSERLYMKDVNELESFSDACGGLSKPLNKCFRDPRANRYAAEIRLREDDVETQNVGRMADFGISRDNETRAELLAELVKPKPILKRKDDSSDLRSCKRVRFDLGVDISGEDVKEFHEHAEGAHNVDSSGRDDGTFLKQKYVGVPDYLLNPSKYTCYSFDSPDDLGDKFKNEANMENLNVRGSMSTEIESVMGRQTTGSPEKIAFVPRAKAKVVKEEADICGMEDSVEEGRPSTDYQPVSHRSIAGWETQWGGDDAIADDVDTEMGAVDGNTEFKKSSRHYRYKKSSDEAE